MLFDLRSRGRRTTVRGVYLALAILMGGGLILFGVGTGISGGGLLNAFGGGSSGNQNQAVSAAERKAEKAVKADPSSPSAWSQLVQARWDTAKGSEYNASSGTFTSAGKTELTKTVQAWQRYLTLTHHPDPVLAIIAARAYAFSGQYSSAASTWEIVTNAEPTSAHGFECLAVSSYAAKETRKGDLATTKALSLLPKTTRTATKTALTQAKSSPTQAQQFAKSC